VTTTAPRLTEQRAYLLRIKETRIVPPLDDRPSFDDCSPAERKAVSLLETMISNGQAPDSVIEKRYEEFSKKQLKRLLAEEKTRTEAPEVEVTEDESIVPPLPAGVALPPDLSKGACRWIDEYIAHSQKWSPRSFANFHEACGWSMLSTIAKRRVVLHLGLPRYTPLFIAIVADTSMSAKSEAAGVNLSVLRKAGLEWMLGADSMTPQAMVGDMSIGKPPANYNTLSEEEHMQGLSQDCGETVFSHGLSVSHLMKKAEAEPDFLKETWKRPYHLPL
jgi:hypothetical protein